MTNDMQKLSWAKVEKARQALHRTLHGVPLVELKDSLDLELFKPPFPITGCICVQDTPENPCPCTDLIFWLLDPPLEVSRTQRRTDRGDEILAFELPRDARVNVELQIPMKLSDLERIAWWGRHCKPGTVASEGLPSLGWVSLARAAGFAIGGLLDDLLGSGGENDNLSDDISDWAAENFPAPGWLQDIF